MNALCFTVVTRYFGEAVNSAFNQCIKLFFWLVFTAGPIHQDDIQIGQLMLLQSKAFSRQAFQSVPVDCTLEKFFANDQA